MQNLGLIYYKTCYDEAKENAFPHLVSGLEEILGSGFSDGDFHCSGLKDLPAFRSFRLETTYPGLTAGLGYAHGVSSNDDSKLGFSFDYATGQPYLPGSTVKGVLRSYFAYPEVVQDAFQMPELDVPALERAIFDEGNDVFLDGVVVRGNGNVHGNIMGEDYITPHSDPIKAPVPIKFLKVLPGVVFEFRFLLSDTLLDGTTVNVERKKAAFRTLLKIAGIGAKTNVGYGGLQEVTERKPRKAATEKVETRSQASMPQSPPVRELFVKGQVYQGVVTNIKETYIYLCVEGQTQCSISIKYHWAGNLSALRKGTTLSVKYLEDRNGWYCFSAKGLN